MPSVTQKVKLASVMATSMRGRRRRADAAGEHTDGGEDADLGDDLQAVGHAEPQDRAHERAIEAPPLGICRACRRARPRGATATTIAVAASVDAIPEPATPSPKR